MLDVASLSGPTVSSQCYSLLLLTLGKSVMMKTKMPVKRIILNRDGVEDLLLAHIVPGSFADCLVPFVTVRSTSRQQQTDFYDCR